MNIYMAVDLECYELPYAIADTAEELAKMCGVTKNNVYSAMSHVKNGRAKRDKRTLVIYKKLDAKEHLSYADRDHRLIRRFFDFMNG